MSHFYGTLQGNRGQATRCGTKNSGIQTVAASWQGCVKVNLYEKDGTDYATVSLAPWHGVGTSKLLYEGPVNGTKEEKG